MGDAVVPDEESAPLAGVTVVVTRSRAQAGALADRLAELGAAVVAFPVIQLVDPEDWTPADAAIAALPSYDWIVFTSANAVERFFERLLADGRDVRGLAESKVAAVGPATAARCMDYGVRPDYVPEDFRAEGVIDGFAERGVGSGSRVLLPRALEAREILPETLRGRGVVVDVVPVYRTVPADPDPEAVAEIARGGVDVVTFTSPSTARNFMAVLKAAAIELPGSTVVASIGPVTTQAAERLGLKVGVEASESTVPALVDAIAGHFCITEGRACEVDTD
jgi:uroporphyrinogen III methyltransferase / synthase